ncbi:hypothetical protein ANO11243_045980 [Dothideomycetidae sp. 11243]|nr:hypothetical protein ANO11243_045980 [fungal sp. No.11243]
MRFLPGLVLLTMKESQHPHQYQQHPRRHLRRCRAERRSSRLLVCAAVIIRIPLVFACQPYRNQPNPQKTRVWPSSSRPTPTQGSDCLMMAKIPAASVTADWRRAISPRPILRFAMVAIIVDFISPVQPGTDLNFVLKWLESAGRSRGGGRGLRVVSLHSTRARGTIALTTLVRPTAAETLSLSAVASQCTTLLLSRWGLVQQGVRQVRQA